MNSNARIPRRRSDGCVSPSRSAPACTDVMPRTHSAGPDDVDSIIFRDVAKISRTDQDAIPSGTRPRSLEIVDESQLGNGRCVLGK